MEGSQNVKPTGLNFCVLNTGGGVGFIRFVAILAMDKKMACLASSLLTEAV